MKEILKKEFILILKTLETKELLYQNFLEVDLEEVMIICIFHIVDSCNLCISSRINLKKFKYTKSSLRNLKKNSDLSLSFNTKNIKKERYELFIKYCSQRHNNGQMQYMSIEEFENFFHNNNNDTTNHRSNRFKTEICMALFFWIFWMMVIQQFIVFLTLIQKKED